MDKILLNENVSADSYINTDKQQSKNADGLEVTGFKNATTQTLANSNANLNKNPSAQIDVTNLKTIDADGFQVDEAEITQVKYDECLRILSTLREDVREGMDERDDHGTYTPMVNALSRLTTNWHSLSNKDKIIALKGLAQTAQNYLDSHKGLIISFRGRKRYRIANSLKNSAVSRYQTLLGTIPKSEQEGLGDLTGEESITYTDSQIRALEIKKDLSDKKSSDDDFFVHNQDTDTHTLLSGHQESTNLGNIREAILQYMPNAYDKISSIKSSPDEGIRTKKLHHAAGRTFRANGDYTLKFNMAGSGYQSFPKVHKGFDGVSDFQDLIKISKTKKKTKLGKQLLNVHVNNQIDNMYGETFQESGGKHFKMIRKKTDTFGKRAQYNIAGPQFMGGIMDAGDYQIKNLRSYMLDLSKAYITDSINKLNLLQDSDSKIHIMINGHSRGAVASIEGALMIKKWVVDTYPTYADRIIFDVIQYDPVPGSDSGLMVTKDEQKNADGNDTHAQKSTHKEVDIINTNNKIMSALGSSANTTVVYSMQTQYNACFTPQAVKNSSRIIITPFSHSVGIDDVEFARQGEKGNLKDEVHRKGYTLASSGDVYRGSGLNELPEGVFIADENNVLVEVTNYQDAERILKTAWANTNFQDKRHQVILDTIRLKLSKGQGNP